LVTGKPGVVLLTAGPGVTNAMTQVADCKLGNVPVLFLGGASATSHDLTEDLQEYDTLTMMKNNTIWSIEVQETHRIAEHIAIAFRNLTGAIPGPVYVELPMDILEINEVDEEIVRYPSRYRTDARIFGDPAEIEKAADLLVNAEKVAISIGDGAQYNCKNFSVFEELAEYLQIPTGVSMSNKGRFFKENKPLYQVSTLAESQADVILLFSQKPHYQISLGLNPEAKIINVHRNSQHIGLNIPLEVGIIGYADAVAEQILAAVKAKTAKRDSNPWVDELWAMKEAVFEGMFGEAATSDVIPMHPGRVASEIAKFMKTPESQDLCYFVDGGDSLTWPLIMAGYHNCEQNFLARTFYASYQGCIGASWGMLNGAYQALKKPILHSIGDGSFGQYVGELYTFAKFKIPYVCVIFNDNNWGMIKAFSMEKVPDQNHDIGAVIAPDYGDGYFHYETIANGWGGYGVCVKKPEDIIPEIKKAVEAAKSGKPAIVNCITDCKDEYFSVATKGLYTQLADPINIRY